MRRQRTVNIRGFTLLEMIIVVGIIGLLMTMLLPVISKSKEFGMEQGCKKNLRELASIILSDAQEHGGFIQVGILEMRDDNRVPYFNHKFDPAEKLKKGTDPLWICPADEFRDDRRISADGALCLAYYTSYAVIQPPAAGGYAGAEGERFPLSKVVTPSQRILLGDNNGSPNAIAGQKHGAKNPRACLQFRHYRMKKWDYLEAWQDEAETLSLCSMDCDSGGDAHLVCEEWLVSRLTHPDNRNRAKACMAFYDGHVESMTFEEYWPFYNEVNAPYENAGALIKTNMFYTD